MILPFTTATARETSAVRSTCKASFGGSAEMMELAQMHERADDVSSRCRFVAGFFLSLFFLF